ncbi:sporulation associated protein [Colletotrichum asianum]|uniref:Sporulation associated protein n=1 Tax=Colletotrichum asianum TaxID=702518 RepID=A0A8H3WIL0_9PEZI|nr:sporulation associated protein [Colletotrichum asianum]
MSFPSDQSQASVDTALSSPQSSPTQQHFPAGRQPGKKKRNLILCFDGTGNDFTASEKDTNVVKLLSMLDRNHEDQFHYYQTGIGTYNVNEKTVHKNTFQEVLSTVERTIDEGFATTFDAHIMAGYRFLMRYYETGDRIYMFGFSRGAYTAKFLARMVYSVGLLCRGNEEMVPFAYRLYDRYLDGKLKCKNHEGEGQDENSDVEDEESDCEDHKLDESVRIKKKEKKERKARTRELRKFSKTFCKQEPSFDVDRPRHQTKVTNVKVHFLGLWDCVNSVGTMEQKATKEVLVKGTAHIIRHAVAVDERRVKFKAALFQQDKDKKQNHDYEDIKEVWFPGNHGDVGGGWDPVKDHLEIDDKDAKYSARIKVGASNAYTNIRTSKVVSKFRALLGMSPVKREKTGPGKMACHVCKDCGLCKAEKCLLSDCKTGHQMCSKTECKACHEQIVCRDATHTKSKQLKFEPCQLSDVPLMWMMKELEADRHVYWKEDKVNEFRHRYEHNKESALNGSVHDPIMFGFGTGFLKVLFWNFLEFFPLIQRWEITHGENLWNRFWFRGKVNDKRDDKTKTWEWIRFPLNKGATRDIPKDATFHESLFQKLCHDETYRPQNNHGDGKPCLVTIKNGRKVKSEIRSLYHLMQAEHKLHAHPDHQVYNFKLYADGDEYKKVQEQAKKHEERLRAAHHGVESQGV